MKLRWIILCIFLIAAYPSLGITGTAYPSIEIIEALGSGSMGSSAGAGSSYGSVQPSSSQNPRGYFSKSSLSQENIPGINMPGDITFPDH